MAAGVAVFAEIRNPCMRLRGGQGEQLKTEIALAAMSELEEAHRVESIERIDGQLSAAPASSFRIEAKLQRGWWKTAAQIPAWAFLSAPLIPQEPGAIQCRRQPKPGTHNEQGQANNQQRIAAGSKWSG